MALTILFTATRSADFRSVAIQDNGTAWGVGGEMGTGSVTAISLYFFGTDKVTPLKVVAFTPQEKTDFLAGNTVTIQMSDTRLYYPANYLPDNFYTLQLHVDGGSVVETQTAIDSYFYIKKIIMESLSNVSVPLETFYQANRSATGDLAAITQLDYLSSVISIPRENKWRKIYDFLANNYANKL
jgi:hypothetical protein